jgi:hypothetical protein
MRRSFSHFDSSVFNSFNASLRSSFFFLAMIGISVM